MKIIEKTKIGYMKFLNQTAQTNWKFIAIVVFVGVFLAGGILMLIPQFEEPTPPLPPSVISSPTPALNEVEGWQTYRSQRFGFEFQYPKVFAEDPQCRVEELENGESPKNSRVNAVKVGSRIGIGVRDAGSLTLSEYVEHDFSTEGLFEVNKVNTAIDEKEAIAISYHVQGFGRLGTVTYVLNRGNVYIFSFLAGSECPAAYKYDTSELNVLTQILSTFRFTK